MANESDVPEDILPDELLAKHLDGSPAGDDDQESQDPDGVGFSPEDLIEGPSDSDEDDDSDISDEDNENDEPGDDELGDEDDESVDDDEDEDDEKDEDQVDDDDDADGEDEDDDADDGDEDGNEDVDDSESFLSEAVTAEEHKLIAKDPILAKAYKSMQSAFTKRTMAAAETVRLSEEREGRVDRFTDMVNTPDGLSDYMASLMKRRPDIAGAAFERATKGDQGFDFLVAIGNESPELLERVSDRVRELADDPAAAASYDRDLKTRSRESSLDRREARARERTYDHEKGVLLVGAEKAARKAGIETDDIGSVTRRLENLIADRTSDDGSINVSSAEVGEIVKEVSGELERTYQKAKERLGREQSSKSRERTKKAAQKGRKRNRVPPRGRKQQTGPRKRMKYTHTGSGDPLDGFVDAAIQRGAE